MIIQISLPIIVILESDLRQVFFESLYDTKLGAHRHK